MQAFFQLGHHCLMSGHYAKPDYLMTSTCIDILLYTYSNIVRDNKHVVERDEKAECRPALKENPVRRDGYRQEHISHVSKKDTMERCNTTKLYTL